MDKNSVVKMRKSNAELNRFVEFSMGASDYAIPLSMVREIISVPEISPILRSPPHLLGLINLHDKNITVIDIRKKLKILAAKNKEEAIIIVNIGGRDIGILVDAINKILIFANNEINEIFTTEDKLEIQYIFGIYKKQYSITNLIDIAKVIDLVEIEIICEIKIAA